jgi:4-hydroxy-3-methylbut-2-en-1-yl diphosphate reductase
MKQKEIKILLAAPRGFCAGVVRAIDIVEKTLDKYGTPVYVRHEIVHNKHVVDNLKKKGAIFIEELNEIDDYSRPVIFSAHGVPKSVPEEASSKKMFHIDATCPLVTKVHREAEFNFKNGYYIFLIGHKNHPEVLGTMGQLPKGTIKLIETYEDAQKINEKKISKPVSYVTQTTLSVDDTKDIIEVLKNKFPKIKSPIKEDICYATTNRQEAVKKIAPMCDMFFVVGSENSSNSQRLVEVAKKFGCNNSELITFDEKLPIDLIIKSKKIGITSGASAPEQLVQNLINEIKKHCTVIIEEIVLTKENVTFKLPKSLK